MSDHPPKKKLRQTSLLDMLRPSTSKENRNKGENNSCAVDLESDSSQNIESSIECMRLGSFSSDTSASDDVELTEKNDETRTEALRNVPCIEEEQVNDNDKSIQNNNEKVENVCESWSFGTKEQLQASSRKKDKQFSGEHHDDSVTTKRSLDSRKAQTESSRDKNLLKISSPKKSSKKLTPKKSPRKSPLKEKGLHSNEEASDRRNILAVAAERRRQLGVTSTPETVKCKVQMSPDLFEDEDVHKGAEETGITWRGSSLLSLVTLNTSNPNLPPVSPAPDHTVMVRLPILPNAAPSPHPSSYNDVWDQYHVKMPCSPKSQYPVGKNSDSLVPRWSIICQSLRRGITNVEEFQRAVLEYNSRYATRWKFRGLQYLLEQEFEEEERNYFFSNTLPAMIRLALNLPNLVTQPPPLLTSRATHSITLSQLQIASLLANAFFCTFPRRNAKGSDTEYANYPDINFNRLFFHKEKRALEKMKCLLSYFRRVTAREPTGLVTFTRQYVSYQELPRWESSSQQLPKFHIDTKGLIEEASGFLQVDFANKYMGGGVLGLGCVQEEIRFVLSPELIVCRLFTQALEKKEALIITGVEQFNRGSGYASSFCWAGSYQDPTPVDSWGRRMCQVTAIDALHFTKQPQVQYRPIVIGRELNKAYAGFRVLDRSPGLPIAIATGNWGCGAFRGDPRLKSLIQLAVCGHIGRDVAYYTFGDENLRDDLSTMYIFLKENNVTVGELVQVLNHHGSREWSDGSDLFHYIYHNLGAYRSDTDDETADPTGPTLDKNRRKELLDLESSCKTRTARSITDYFKRAPKSYSSSYADTAHGITYHHTSTSKQNGSNRAVSGSVTKDPLSEEKILQVLTECDRLVGGQKVISQGNYDAGSSSRTRDINVDQVEEPGSVAKSRKSVSEDQERDGLAEETKIRVSKSTSEPSRLLSYLDAIDKGTAT